MVAVPDSIPTLSVTGALVQVSHLVDRVFAEVARQHGLTPQQVQLLCVVGDGPVGMKELACGLSMEKSSLTGLVDRVERRGLITRVRDAHDRRAWLVAVTDEGERVSHKCHRAVVDRLEALADDLSTEDKQRFVSLAAQLVAGEGDGR